MRGPAIVTSSGFVRVHQEPSPSARIGIWKTEESRFCLYPQPTSVFLTCDEVYRTEDGKSAYHGQLDVRAESVSFSLFSKSIVAPKVYVGIHTRKVVSTIISF